LDNDDLVEVDLEYKVDLGELFKCLSLRDGAREAVQDVSILAVRLCKSFLYLWGVVRGVVRVSLEHEYG